MVVFTLLYKHLQRTEKEMSMKRLFGGTTIEANSCTRFTANARMCKNFSKKQIICIKKRL
jgi:tRNA isopentenyl-2-thiomethyl-A-37 hydroxylase MiaE